MSQTSESETIVKETTIAAPAERVFSALSDPAQRVRWWGAEGRFKTKDMKSDLRVGGSFEMSGDGMGGRPFTLTGEYRAIDPPRVLESTWRPGWQRDSLESVVRFDLEETAGVTRVRLTHSGLSGETARMQHQGWPEVLSWLKSYVEAG